MPEVQEVFRMATQKVRPDPGAMERQRQKQRWHSGKQKAAVYALAAGLVAVGIIVGIARLWSLAEGDRNERPATEPGGPAIDPRLTGIWWLVSGNREAYPGGRFPLLYRFSADGTFAMDYSGQLDWHPAAQGTYEVNGDTVVLTTSRSQRCAATMTFPQEGGLNLVFTEDEDFACASGSGSDFNFTRVSPGTRGSERIRALADAEQGTPPVRINNRVQGIWLLEGTDFLLRIGFDGYAIADQGRLGTDPNDVGTIETDGEGTLTFTSGAGSPTCAEGTVTEWENVLVNDDALAANIPADACGGPPEGRRSWVQISWP